jgi:hypothetical protein
MSGERWGAAFRRYSLLALEHPGAAGAIASRRIFAAQPCLRCPPGRRPCEGQLPRRARRKRLCRGEERRDRVPHGGRPLRSFAGIGSRSCAPEGRRDQSHRLTVTQQQLGFLRIPLRVRRTIATTAETRSKVRVEGEGGQSCGYCLRRGHRPWCRRDKWPSQSSTRSPPP